MKRSASKSRVQLQDEVAQLTVKDPVTPVQNLPLQFHIGHLDPVEEKSGQLARLTSLGYYDGPKEAPDDQFQSAVEEFQCEHQLPVNGLCNAQTQAKLMQIHGC